MTVDEVDSSQQTQRSGFELSAPIAGGDSGSGVFDRSGRLLGVVFARSTERTATGFAVDAAAVENLMGMDRVSHQCDPLLSRSVPVRSAE